MPLSPNIYGAGLKDAKIKIAAGTEYDIMGVVTVEGSPEISETEIKGDDTVLGTFVSAQKETLTVTANAVSFDVIQAITGNTYTTSASAGEIAIGTENEQNPPFVEVSAFTTAKDSTGVAVTIKKVWHKVQIKSTKISQANEQEFTMELEGVAIPTTTEIDGSTALTTKRISTLSYTA